MCGTEARGRLDIFDDFAEDCNEELVVDLITVDLDVNCI